MNNSTAIIALESTAKIWSVALTAAAITIGCQQKEVRVEVPIETVKTNTVFVTNTVVKTNTLMVTNIVRVTNELVKEFPLVAEKIVPVKASIPKDYKAAFEIVNLMNNAKVAKKDDEAFHGIPSIHVRVYVSEKFTDKLSTDAIRNKIELKLRQAGIKVDLESPYWLVYSLDGFWEDNGIRANYSVSLELTEMVTVTRRSPPSALRTIASIWKRGTHGFAGSKVLESSAMNNADTFAEAFANAFLEQNPK